MNSGNPERSGSAEAKLTRRRFFKIGGAALIVLGSSLLVQNRVAQAEEDAMSLTPLASQEAISQTQDFEKLEPWSFPLIDSTALRLRGSDITSFVPQTQRGFSWEEVAAGLGENALLQGQPQVGGESLSIRYDSSRPIRPDHGAYLRVNPSALTEEATKPGILVRFPGDMGQQFQLGVGLRNISNSVLVEARYLPNSDLLPDSHEKRYHFRVENSANEPFVIYLGVVQKAAREVRLIGNAEKAIYIDNYRDGLTTHIPSTSK